MAAIEIKLAKRFWGQGLRPMPCARSFAICEKGFKVIVVSPNSANEAALKLYKRLGFEPKNRFWVEETQAMHQIWALTGKRFEDEHEPNESTGI